MVQRNIGDDGDQRIDNVSCIQPPPHTHFQNGNIDLRFSKVQQSLRRKNLEKTRKLGKVPIQNKLLSRIVHSKIERRKRFVVYLLSIQSYTLVHAREMRRSVKARAQSR